MEFISRSVEQTYDIAKEITLKLSGGDILLLNGDLGSGKTTFAKGLAEALGIKKAVTSPTFTIMKMYELSEKFKDVSKLFHLDCYRLGRGDHSELGLPELFEDENAIFLIEWPDKIDEILPNTAKRINFEYINESSRKLTTDF